MLWGLPPQTWLELWSGAIGALVSAVGAALVAWLVVKATNKHQQQIADRAYKAQQKDAAKALQVQRELLEQQITEQRLETRRAEKVSALSDFIAGVQEIGTVHRGTDPIEIVATKRHLEVAAAKLDILADDGEGLHELLQPCIQPLYLLSLLRLADFKLTEVSGADEHLAECTRAVSTLVPKWWSTVEGHERRFIRGEIRLTLDQARTFLLANNPFANS